jgi:hypothetical protein
VASAYDLVNAKIGTAVHVILDAVAGQSWPLSAPATLWLAIGAVGLFVGVRGLRAARRLVEQRPGHQHGRTDAAAGQAAGAERLPAGCAVRHADAHGAGGHMSPSPNVSITATNEPAPR